MYINFAQLELVLSILISSLIPFGFVWLKSFNVNKFSKLLDYIVLLQFICISFAFVALSYAYVNSDFSVLNVFRNSHMAVPLIYRFTGLWSNHEGSMILWLFLLSLMNLIVALQKIEGKEKIWLSATQIMVTASLALYTVLKSNPFIKLAEIPAQGLGFNPLLQDIGLAIHPPILYIGYVSSVVAFAISISALINKRLSLELLAIMQKWVLLSWSFLTLGVALGSWWAYRELGWGGYWFWDPVENASLLPWLTSTALIHSIYATKKLDTNYRWTILLAIITFLLSILATFLVRSGAVTSVHSFASDPDRGGFIFGLLICYSFVSLGLFALKAHNFDDYKENNWLSRFGGINVGNIFWVIAMLTILGSLLYPIALGWCTGDQIAIERYFFENSFLPILLIILVVMSLTLPSTWQAILPAHYRYFRNSCFIAAILFIGFYYLCKPSFTSAAAFFVGSLVVIRMCFWLKQRLSGEVSYKFYLIWLVHIAAGLFAITLAILETNSQELTVSIREGGEIKFLDFNIRYAKNENLATQNFLSGKVILYVEKDDSEIAILKPEIRYYPIEKSQTSESSIYHSYFYDLYAVISETTKDGAVTIKLYYKPLITWLWVICGIVFMCGLLLLMNIKKKAYAKII